MRRLFPNSLVTGEAGAAGAAAGSGCSRPTSWRHRPNARNEAWLRIGTPAERFSGGGRETGVPVDVQAVEL